MAVIGRRSKPKSNRVNPVLGLPLEFTHGSISVSMNFESHPTGSISIEKIPESEVVNYRRAYNVQGRELTLFRDTSKPLFFRINGYAETEDTIYDTGKTEFIRVFSISVNLEGGHNLNSKKNVFIRNSSKEYLPSYEPRLNVTNGKFSLHTLASAAGLSYQGLSYFQDVDSSSGSNFTVNFEQTLQNILRTKSSIVDYTGPSVITQNYASGKQWSVGIDDILYSIEVNRQKPTEYRNTLLNGKNGSNFNKQESLEDQKEEDILGDDPQKLPPITQILEEGDKLPLRPPSDATQIKTLDMCFDKSGPRKTRKVTTLLNGQPIREEVYIYGFVYTAEEIRNPAADLETASIDTPALLVNLDELIDYWKLIEYQVTTYNYEQLNLKVRIQAEDPENGDKLPVKYMSSKDSSLTSFNSSYLTSVVTTGWKLARFQSEELASADTVIEDILDTRIIYDSLIDDGVTLTKDPVSGLYSYSIGVVDSPQLSFNEVVFFVNTYNSLTFRRIPFQSATQYKLYPNEQFYENIETSPFRIQEVAGVDIGYPSKDKVIVAIPDRQWTYPMMLMEETTLTQSFSSMDDPKNIFVRDDRAEVLSGDLSASEKREALKELKLYPDLVVGEDTFQKVERKVLQSSFTNPKTVGQIRLPQNKFQSEEPDKYLEFETRASSHDHNFRNSLQNVTFRTILGRPSDASTFQERFGTQKEDKQDEDSSASEYEYRLTSSTNPDVEVIDSVQYETNSLAEAFAAAKAELILTNFLNSYEENINLAWYYPEIRPGDYLSFTDEPSRGLRKVKSTSFSVQYKGYVDGEIVCTCDGTNLVVGKFEDRNFATNKVRKADSNANGFEITTSITGERLLGVSPVPIIRTRKNPIALNTTTPEDAI